MTSKCETLIEQGRAVTIQAVRDDLNAGEMSALYYASEDQILSLIESGAISEDYLSHHQTYQEEARCLMADVRCGSLRNVCRNSLLNPLRQVAQFNSYAEAAAYVSRLSNPDGFIISEVV